MEIYLATLAVLLLTTAANTPATLTYAAVPEVREIATNIATTTPPVSLPAPAVEVKPTETLSPLLRKLCMKESTCNPYAVNKKDTDGLSKHGLYQYDYQSFYDVNKLCKVIPDLQLSQVPEVIYDRTTQIQLTECAIAKGQGWRWPPLKKIIT